jgi:ABC-type polysaccharide/polyol phosphate transport system ATPase subunit
MTDTVEPFDPNASGVALASPPAVRCTGVTKSYSTAQGRRGVQAAFGHAGDGDTTKHALRGLDLEVPHGQALGVIGPNGAGKTTFLKLVAQITRPTTGSLLLDGSVRSVIELSAGFHPDLTGTENVRCLGVVYGQALGEIDAALPRIAAFAGIGDAMERPVKHYSVGMRARLAFALVTDQRPAILAVDEVLSVGDQDFQVQCLDRIQRMLDQGTTLLFVSHEMPLVAAVCNRVVQLRDGRLVDDGPPEAVIERYLTRSASRIARAPDSPVAVHRAGVVAGRPDPDSLQLWVDVDASRAIAKPAIGLEIVLPLFDPDNVVGSSTVPLPAIDAPGRYRITGTGDTASFAAANMRFRMSVVDQERHRVLDVTSLDAERLGDVRAVELHPNSASLTVPVEWEMERVLDEGLAGGGVPWRVASERAAAVADEVSKHYSGRGHRVPLQAALPGRLGRLRDPDTVALDGATLAVAKGESVGLIGPNGSGKTTMLRVLAGVTRPDCGEFRVARDTVSVLELGAGFHSDLSGNENVRILARLMGLAAGAIDRVVADAHAFSGLGDAIDDQLRTYSTGMRARLAMALALSVPAELILIDEVLAVGDEAFRRQVVDRLVERQKDGLAVLFVSHDLQVVEQVCERVIRLAEGRSIADGPTDEVVGAYAGHSWAGGVHDADGGIRLQRLSIDSHRVPTGGSLVVEGSVVVDEPCPHARLEFALRAAPTDRQDALTIEERASQSAVMVTVVPRGQELIEPGSYRFRCQVRAEHLVGEADVVVAAVDDDRHIVLCVVWEQVVIGSPEPGAHLSMDVGFAWSLERLDEG